jgi:O-antigen/teichoic acid export membrane protein/rubredoxin
MKKLVRCKSCGYVMAEEKLGETCPACGVSREMFEPYTDPVGESRRRILDMHLHPIAVHFPTSFAAAIVVLLVAGIFVSGAAGDYVTFSVKLMVLALPVLVLAAFLAGLVDGTIRFRRIGRSRILRTKTFYGTLFFVLAAGVALLVWTKGLDASGPRWASIVLDAGAVGCSAVLGILGMRIRDAAFPGK